MALARLAHRFVAPASWPCRRLAQRFVALALWLCRRLAQRFVALALRLCRRLAQRFVALALWLWHCGSGIVALALRLCRRLAQRFVALELRGWSTWANVLWGSGPAWPTIYGSVCCGVSAPYTFLSKVSHHRTELVKITVHSSSLWTLSEELLTPETNTDIACPCG